MLGGFGVGKTSLVRRFVSSMFSEKYLTTVGVKIDKKTVAVDGGAVDLLIWDLQGEDEARETPEAYLRGAAGCALVADGTRGATMDTALAIRERVRGVLGDVPFLFLLNKSDLGAEWDLGAADVARLDGKACAVLRTSAKTGEGVEEAFAALARAVAGNVSGTPALE